MNIRVLRGERRFSVFVAFSASPSVCIRSRHSMGDEVDVIATLILLALALEPPREIDRCGFSYLGTIPTLAKGTRAW